MISLDEFEFGFQNNNKIHCIDPLCKWEAAPLPYATNALTTTTLLTHIHALTTGSFRSKQIIDILGPVADVHNPFQLSGQVIHSLVYMFEGVCEPVLRVRRPIFNPGHDLVIYRSRNLTFHDLYSIRVAI